MEDMETLPETALERKSPGGKNSQSPEPSQPRFAVVPVLAGIGAGVLLTLAVQYLFSTAVEPRIPYICLICVLSAAGLAFFAAPAGRRFLNRRKHGIIQTLTWAVFAVVCAVIFLAVRRKWMKTHYAWLLGGVLLAVTVAITCSHAYNYQEGSQGGNPLCEQAAKKRATWLHANHCWQILNVSMTIIPLYCTCAAIYLSGNQVDNSMNDILIYSILSLVISLGTYVIRPANRAAGYRRAYIIVDEALTNLEYSESGDRSVAEALTRGTQIVADQDILDPK